MNKTTLNTSIAAILGSISMGAQANLGTSAVLEFDPGIVTCVFNLGTPPDNCTYATLINTTGAGSYFGMDVNGSGTISKTERTAISMHDGVHMGVAQPASGTHSGAPFGAANNYQATNFVQVGQTSLYSPIYLAGDGTDPNNTTTDTSQAYVATTTEVPGIDEPWNFFGGTGMHFTSSPIIVIDNDVNGDGGFTKTLDFSGWGVTWNGIAAINMGSGNHSGGAGDGLATITCSDVSCSQSSTFMLDYFAAVPLNDPSGFGGVQYALHLEGQVGGTVSAVPVPAAVWLFGSGLIGLIGIAKRTKHSR